MNVEQKRRADYVRSHPELPLILAKLKADLLKDKPEDISFYLSEIFFSHHNREEIESSIGMSLPK
jgi:hypothetical protein